jgi:hypothetical protein
MVLTAACRSPNCRGVQPRRHGHAGHTGSAQPADVPSKDAVINAVYNWISGPKAKSALGLHAFFLFVLGVGTKYMELSHTI